MYTGVERRHEEMNGRSGRRSADWHCGDHDLIQDTTKEHRVLVCSKISNLKEDIEKDISELKSHIDRDMETTRLGIEKKADGKDLRGMIKMVSILIVICCAIVAGQAVWLKNDIGVVSTAIQRLNIRVTESTNDRMKTDFEQSQKLESISGQINVVSWRLSAIEDSHKTEVKNRSEVDK
jgi:hypothetical protein